MGAPRIDPYDADWPRLAADGIREISMALADLPGHEDFAYDHIGSTAVPGLAAKPIIDLQLRCPALPDGQSTQALLAPLGFTRARGSRPDSPGVDADIPRPHTDPDPAAHAKLLFHRPASGAQPEVILHVRRADSPFAAFVLEFRDWLRSDPVHAARYETVKRNLAAVHADAADYDDYTRAKTQFLDQAQREMGFAGSAAKETRRAPASQPADG